MLVSFLDGDPDRPIVTGALYNSQTIPPDKLPAQQTRTTFKSRSSPDGGGHNTLRIDDKKHQEQIYVHAQKDLDYYIRNDKRESIGHQRHRIVQGSAYDHIENNQHRTIGKDHNLQIDGQQSRSIGQSMEQKIGQNYREHAAVEYHLKAGAGVVLDAGQSLTLKAAGSSVVLDETGVSVTGLMVLINSGGGAGSAKGASASAPKTSEPVDPGHAGSPIPSLGADARFKNAPVEFEPAAFSAIEKPKDITPTQGEGFGADDALSLSLDLIPGVGTAKGVVELIAGFDPVTGEEIPRWISTAALAASIIPGGKAAVRGARTAGKMAKHADEAVDVGEAVVKHGDEVADVSEAAVKSGDEVVLPNKKPKSSKLSSAQMLELGDEKAKAYAKHVHENWDVLKPSQGARKPSTVDVIVTRDGRVFEGYNTKKGHPNYDDPLSKVDDEIKDAYGSVPISERMGNSHGFCAEVSALQKAKCAGADLEGAVSIAAEVKTGRLIRACDSCNPALGSLGVFDGVRKM